MKKKIKKYFVDHKEDMIIGAVCSLEGIFVYTVMCKRLGYRMTKPYRYDENYFYVKTLSGQVLRSQKLD